MLTAPASVVLPLPLLHAAQPLRPHDLWFTRDAWPLEWSVWLPLLLAGAWYLRGVRALWHHAGRGRGVAAWRVWAFGGGLGVAGLALLTPLAALGGALFSAHMVQHVLLMLVAAPLLVLGAPSRVLAWGLPRRWRASFGRIVTHSWLHRSWRWLTAPVVAWLVHAAVILAWHHPLLFQATLRSELLHVLQHVLFFGSAVLFWAALDPRGRATRLPALAAVLYLFTTGVYGAALGALFTIADRLFYPAYARSAVAWGLTPLQDQQLAGLVMWVPAGLIYVGAALVVMVPLLREGNGRTSATARAGALAHRRARAIVWCVFPVILLAACDRGTALQTGGLVPGADPERGRVALQRHGCGSCHMIPGVPGATGRVGPPLGQLARKTVIAGRLPNSPDAIIAFTLAPDALDPRTLMPVTGISEREARDATAYLLRLR